MNKTFLHLLPALLIAPAFSMNAQAWGPAVHLWLAKEVTGKTTPTLLVGAALPDIDALAGDYQGAVRELTHDQFDLLPKSPFARGFATHNQLWGADAYAHGAVNPDTQQFVQGYLRDRAVILGQESGLDIDTAALYMEAATDLLLRRDQGPWIGMLMLQAALRSGEAPRLALVETYSAPLSASTDLNDEEAEALIARSASAFRLALMFYGLALTWPEPLLEQLAPLALAAYTGEDLPTAQAHLNRALELCADYQVELDRIVPLIRAHEPPARK